MDIFALASPKLFPCLACLRLGAVTTRSVARAVARTSRPRLKRCRLHGSLPRVRFVVTGGATCPVTSFAAGCRSGCSASRSNRKQGCVDGRDEAGDCQGRRRKAQAGPVRVYAGDRRIDHCGGPPGARSGHQQIVAAVDSGRRRQCCAGANDFGESCSLVLDTPRRSKPPGNPAPQRFRFLHGLPLSPFAIGLSDFCNWNSSARPVSAIT